MQWEGPKVDRPRVASDSFDDFYLENFGRVVVVVTALTGSVAHAEEVAQEAFIRTFLRWRSVSEMQHRNAWVRRVAINLALSRVRRWKAEGRAILRAAAGAARTQADEEFAAGDDFWNLVRQLPPRQAAAVALHYADDLRVADIALVMGCAEGTVKAHLHAARQSLAGRLVKEHRDERR